MTDPESGTRRAGPDSSWRELLRELNVTPSKALGQNFLHDQKIVQRIVQSAEIDDETDVLEIGPGLGIMTRELTEQARSVTAVELDQRLAVRLQDYFRNKATIIQGDILEVDVGSIVSESPYIVVANLPYSIATAVVQRLLETSHPPVRMIIMVQREVAERMAARPPEMSILSVAVQFYARPKILFRIGSGAFIPRPRVESSVIRLDLRAEAPLPREDHPAFFRLVRAGFSQRRKRLDNAISAALSIEKSVVRDRITDAMIDPGTRAERLDVPEWVELFGHMRELLDA
jgi:16S rRNA (adenine1518-N6/adenine1519-N6)-dimethyltransferase